MMRAVAAVLVALCLAGCAESPRAPLWNAFDLLVLAENTSGQVTLFRCAANDDASEWGEPAAVLADARWADASSVAVDSNGDAFVVTAHEVVHVTPLGDVAQVWRHPLVGDLAHLSFDSDKAKAYITDRAAAAVFVVDTSTAPWRDVAGITDECLSRPIATRVRGKQLEILDRDATGLLITDREGNAPVTFDKRDFGDVVARGFVGSDDILDANPEHVGPADIQEQPFLICDYGGHSHPTVLVAGGMSAPNVTPVAGAVLIANGTVVLGRSIDGTLLIFNERARGWTGVFATTSQTLVPCPDLGRPIGIALVE